MFRHIANLDSIKDSERRRTKNFGILVGQRSTSSREFYENLAEGQRRNCNSYAI